MMRFRYCGDNEFIVDYNSGGGLVVKGCEKVNDIFFFKGWFVE